MTERTPQTGRRAAAPTAWPDAEPGWALFHHNQSIWAAVMEQCDAARRSIRLEQYIFGTRGIGRQLLELLAAKARQGVDVQILADGLGSFGLGRSDGGRAVVRNGGTITLYNGVRDILRDPVGRAHRLHRKTLVTDDNAVMVGGTCYADRMSSWRDTMIRLEGPLPPAISREFDRAAGRARDGAKSVPLPLAGTANPRATWSYALGGPGIEGEPNLRSELAHRITAAEHTVWLTTPYLIPNRRLWRALVAAAGRGVQVRILMPARSDHRPLDLIGHRFAQALSGRGVEVNGYEAGMIHAKVALIDGTWSSVSSFNLDVFSGNLNLESGVVSTSPALQAALSEQWHLDWARSWTLAGRAARRAAQAPLA